MKRGEVWWVNFDPSVGGEIQKKRPAVIVSNDSSNKFLNRLQVVPLTSKVEKVFPSEALIEINGKKGKAAADQVTTVSKLRLSNILGKLSEADVKKVEKAIGTQLGL
jgi:mRNA interferase MazF